jgi:hypothetical protein
MTNRNGQPHTEVGKEKSKGWHCALSPDLSCHYFSQWNHTKTGRIVRLANGTAHGLPWRYDHEHETPDDCIFCGLPEERK